MRTVAILLVLFSHSGLLLAGSYFAGFPWLIFLDGVEIFFVLSGFLIGTILLKQFLGKKQDILSLLNFWIRRWFRTLPAYYLILLINVIFAYFGITGSDFAVFSWKFLFFLQNFNWYFYGFFGESWSLSIEEWFYISFPILLFSFHCFFSVSKSILLSVGILIGIAFYFRITRSINVHNNFMWDFQLRKIVLTRLDAVIYGVVVAWVALRWPNIFMKWRYWSLVLGVVILFYSNKVPMFPTAYYYKTVFFSVQSVGISLCLPFLYFLKPPLQPIKTVVTWISSISYSLYLLHSIVLGILISHFPPVDSTDALPKYFLFWVTSLAFAHFMYKYYEKPMTDLRDAKFILKMRMLNR